MKIVLQRVTEASVEVAGEVISSTGFGLLLLVGVDEGDSEKNADFLAMLYLRALTWSPRLRNSRFQVSKG